MSLKIVQNFILLLLLLCIYFHCYVEAKKEQYCTQARCESNNLACKAKRGLSQACQPGTRVVSMKPHSAHILNLLNEFRNKVAAGYTRTLFPAGRMARMSWSAELENFAILYAKRCSPDPRPCMASPQFTIIGSIYDGLTYTGKESSQSIPQLISELLGGWFADARYVTRELLMHLTPKFRKPTVRQAVLLMADRNTHVGCSAVKFSSGFSNHFRLACAFATDNMINVPIYKIAAMPAKNCHLRDKQYKNLCALGEKYNNGHKYKIDEVIPNSAEVIDTLLE